jgi:lipopolysaccharide transport system ATP-binding protein
VLQPTTGRIDVNGRVAVLLELGAGFNPEFTGRENVYLNATLLGLHEQEIRAKFDEIVAFSGISEFIDQPVKTYSSGMYVRLAFSIATSVDPDILIIDEALSVGDGAFARQSFDRIMKLKARGVTILFCSHNVYQVEAMCQRVLWLDRGSVRALGQAAAVCQQYNQFLDGAGAGDAQGAFEKQESIAGVARINEVHVNVEGSTDSRLVVQSKQSTLAVDISFISSLEFPCPSVALIITDGTGRNLSSCSNHYDGVEIHRDVSGLAQVRVRFPSIHLLRGRYVVNIFLLCERAIHIYDSARCAEFDVVQSGLEVGVVALAHEWEQL